ncbi:MAG: ABC transporter permease [Alkalispirochaeta sp.]
MIGGVRRYLRPVILAVLLAGVTIPAIWGPVAGVLFSAENEQVYQRTPMSVLLVQHIALAGSATIGATVTAVLIGVLVTRPAGRSLVPLVRDLAALAQTIPPVAVLVLAVPLFGFGTAPTVLALFLFSLLPILGNTVTGIDQIDPALLEASTAMGMRPWRRLLETEIPLAAPVIVAGIRTAAVISVGTATIGATIGAGGLGVVIIAGLVRDNLAFVTAGAVAAAALALFIDWFFGLIPIRTVSR